MCSIGLDEFFEMRACSGVGQGFDLSVEIIQCFEAYIKGIGVSFKTGGW